jgi:hypothetical protein
MEIGDAFFMAAGTYPKQMAQQFMTTNKRYEKNNRPNRYEFRRLPKGFDQLPEGGAGIWRVS